MKQKNSDFCTFCRTEREYEVRKEAEKETIKDKEYIFVFTKVYCKKCGEEMNPPGLMDLNIKERDEQYRATEGILAIEDIEKLMKIYNLGKAPLSLALGFGEVTITRYLEGQMPSKAYSDIMAKALTTPAYMEKLLQRNREKVGETAYKKAMKAVAELKNLFNVSEKLLMSISYIFEQLEEVTPLALQKLLYYVQGIYMSLYEKPLFEEDCMAWQHGPVYEKVYFLFKDFKYNPIEDNRFALLAGREKSLSDEERRVIKSVTDTFGQYSGKVLENLTHNESPWKEARKGYGVCEVSHVCIEKEEIKKYFKEAAKIFGFTSNEGIQKYIYANLEGRPSFY